MSTKKMGNITVFRNVYRHDDDAGPNYRGKMDIGNQIYDIALWINDEVNEVPLNMSGQVTQGEYE